MLKQTMGWVEKLGSLADKSLYFLTRDYIPINVLSC